MMRYIYEMTFALSKSAKKLLGHIRLNRLFDAGYTVVVLESDLAGGNIKVL